MRAIPLTAAPDRAHLRRRLRSSITEAVDKQMLEGAPTYDADEEFQWTPDYGQRVDKYYNAPSYWPSV